MFEYWLPLLVWLASMFVFSSDAFSAGETSHVIVPILHFLFRGMPPEQIDFWHGVIRKLAHITEYFILAVLVYRTLRHEGIDPLQAKVQAPALVLLAAMLDEYHQSLTMFRGPSIVDVGYDCLGAVWALWIISVYETWRLRSHSVL